MDSFLTLTIQDLNREIDQAVDPDEPKIRVNEAIGRAAFAYEKFRNTLDYQEEHLFLKNAIKRILRRQIVREQDRASRLMHELVWARYFENESIPQSRVEDVASLMRKYAFVRSHIVSKIKPNKVREIVLGFTACEIEEMLNPSRGKNQYLKFVANQLEKIITPGESEIDLETLHTQIEIAIEILLFKADQDQLYFHLMKKHCAMWPDINKPEAEDIAARFDEIIASIDDQLTRIPNSKVYKFIRRNLPPYIVLWQILNENRRSASKIAGSANLLQDATYSVIGRRNQETFRKVVRALVRGIIFILLTKTILAFIIEMPYETNVFGSINYTALIINISLPPALMLIAGLFIRVPSKKNTQLLVRMVQEITQKNELPVRPLMTLETRRGRGYFLFNTVYTVLSLGIIAAVVYLLIYLKFNVVSIALFFVFVSIVSFLAFRIRAIARELEMRSSEEGIITGVFSFVLLPFVIIGQWLSNKWAQYNFTLWFWDFIVEAPFKIIIAIFENWLTFVREKREGFE